MTTSNGESEEPRGPLELNETLTIETDEGAALSFEVVGVLEDPDAGASYAVLHHQAEGDDEDEFIVTDLEGNLIEDDELAQHVLDDFLAFAEEEEDDEGHSAQNGEA